MAEGRAGLLRRLQHGFEFMVVQAGNDGGEADADRASRICQAADRLQPLGGRGGARLHRPRQLAVQRGDGDEGRGQTAPPHVAQDVGVARDQHRLGDDAERVVEALHDLQDRTGRIRFALDRLIGVGVAAYVDAPADVPGL
jgi:hypothetical protein